MSQDIVSDALNQLMNAKLAGKQKIITKKYSKILINLLELVKKAGYIDYQIDNNYLTISLNENLNEFRVIKPRYNVSVKKINKYVRRFLPARNFGNLIISTNKGLMFHKDAEDKNMGGCLIAYIF